MGALPPVPNVIKSRIFWTIGGDANAFTILYYHYSSAAPDETDLTAYNTEFDTLNAASWGPEMTSDISYVGCDSRDLSSDMGAYAITSNTLVGSRSGGRLSPGTAALMNYKVHRHYRGGKPRSYFPLGSATDVASTGLWADAFVTEYSGVVEGFLVAVPNTYGSLVVDYQCNVSYYGPPNKILTNPSTGRSRTVSTRRDAPGGTGHPLVDQITARAGTKTIGSQRRRNRNA